MGNAGSAFSDIGDGFVDTFKSIGNGFKDAFEPLGSFFQDFGKGFLSVFDPFINLGKSLLGLGDGLNYTTLFEYGLIAIGLIISVVFIKRLFKKI